MRLNEVVFTDAEPIEGYGPGFFRIGGKKHDAPLVTGATGTMPWGAIKTARPCWRWKARSMCCLSAPEMTLHRIFPAVCAIRLKRVGSGSR